MIQQNIHEQWGTKIEFDNPLDFFKEDPSYWRNLIYSRKLLLFKNMQFTKQDYAKFGMCFGKLWDKKDYEYSVESTEPVDLKKFKFFISPISNIIAPRLGQEEMDWHSDIPNRLHKPFPIRSLWMYNNPNPNAGFTTWLNIEDGLSRLTPELAEQVPNIKIIQQSWYKEDTDIQEFSFIKEHPITGKKSLRLNYFCDPEKNITDAWIKNTLVNGELKECKPVLGPYLKYLSSQPDLVYKHQWDNFDIIVYDNWPFVHNRTHLDLKPTEERLFYRLNIDHLNEKEQSAHKNFLKFLF